MKCNIIGAGRLGKNIALALSNAHLISSLSICNSNLEHALKACEEINFGTAIEDLRHLPEADVIWICCNDDLIPHMVDLLIKQSSIKAGCFIIHCSGVLNSKILSPLKTKGCFVASFHPLKAFKTNYLDAAAFNQVDCVLEGDKEACDWIKQSFTHLHACINTIHPENKAMYHAAACIASNYLIALASCSEELFLKAGLTQQQSRRMLINLMQGNLSNLHANEQIADSLTGPLARGDSNTLSLHLNAIQNPLIQQLYKVAGLATLPLTKLPGEKKEKMKLVLE